ncbi:MAG: aminopeptidase P family protein [Candidatus Bathyarchaeota archaeon]|nr:aminopeptidase P family protein [Candidatus Bathyarchaeota archaeon]
MKRTDALKQSAAKQGKPSNFAIFNQTNLTYFTGFSGATALLIPEQGENILYVSGVNYEQAKAEAQGVTVQLLKRGENLIEKIAKQAPTKRFAVDALPVESWRALAKAVGGEENLQPINSLIRELRSVKDNEETKLIREACRLASVGMQTAKEIVGVGLKEKEAAAEIEYAMRKAGSDGTAFETIVASGATSAFPHGSNLERTIREGDFVVVDLGATYKLYRSDITRTFIASKASEKQARIYDTVKLAHQKAFEAIRPQIAASEVDRTARHVIEEAGFGEFFVHNLGHGVGLEVHEAPILSPDSKDILAAGNVVTDEPGIYVPGFGGVRIEDTVLVTKNGAEILTVGPCMP